MQLVCYTVALISDNFFTFWFIFSEATGLIHSKFYTEFSHSLSPSKSAIYET
jgi:hypothetical protein